jgi:hypothetical protein
MFWNIFLGDIVVVVVFGLYYFCFARSRLTHVCTGLTCQGVHAGRGRQHVHV